MLKVQRLLNMSSPRVNPINLASIPSYNHQYIELIHKMGNLACIKGDNSKKIITLCGSTKFKDTFYNVNEYLTLYNKIILMPGVYCHADNRPITEEQKILLDKLHKEKIALSDAIIVINENNYIGSSTNSEILYAEQLNKDVIYLF